MLQNVRPYKNWQCSDCGHMNDRPAHPAQAA